MIKELTASMLRTGEKMIVRAVSCPSSDADQKRMREFLADAFESEDFSIEATVRGDYEKTSRNIFFTGEIGGKMIGSSWYVVSKANPEMGGFGEVYTEPNWRGKGVAAAVCKVAIDYFLASGGKTLYLATANPVAKRIYERIGFTTYTGNVMRYLVNADKYDEIYFSFDMNCRVRQAVWGDLPGVTALFTYPHPWLIKDYQRGRFSSRYVHQKRCVGIFPPIFYEVQAQDGICSILENSRECAMGMATITPRRNPLESHTGVLDFFLHENYLNHAKRLLHFTLEESAKKGTKGISVFLSSFDRQKASIIEELGFRKKGAITNHFLLKGQFCHLLIYYKDINKGSMKRKEKR